jgi:hypothetical protein
MKGLASIRVVGALVVLALVAPAHARGVLGFIPSADAPPSAGQRANFKRGSRFTMTETGLLQNLCAYVDGGGGSTARSQLLRVVLYSDDNGVPGTKIIESNPVQQLSSSYGGVRGSHCDQLSQVPLTPGNYWLMLHTGGTAGVIRYFQGPEPNWYGNTDTFSDGASDPFGSGGSGAGTVSLFAQYYTPDELYPAGRTTIGTNPSAGLRSDFKRGSPIDVTVAGKVAYLTAYLDTLGGNTGTQGVTFALYGDSNGVPGSLITSETRMMPAGLPARWWTFAVPATWIPPGRYWVILHTGENTGIIRYYADGTGNWYGNADLFSDGPSSTFGNGGTGHGRISAFASILLK